MILGDHAEYLACPCLQCLWIDSRVVGPQGLRDNIVWGWVFTIHPAVNLTNGLLPCLHHPDQIGRHLGLGDSTLSSAHGPLVPVGPGTIAHSLPPWGGLTGPPEVAGFSPPLVGAGLLLWRGVGAFPPGPEVDDFPPWLEVNGFPPWFEVDPCSPQSGVGWALSCCLPEAPAAGVSVWVSLGGRGQPLGQALGTLGAGCPWRQGTIWSRSCWATLQW